MLLTVPVPLTPPPAPPSFVPRGIISAEAFDTERARVEDEAAVAIEEDEDEDDDDEVAGTSAQVPAPEALFGGAGLDAEAPPPSKFVGVGVPKDLGTGATTPPAAVAAAGVEVEVEERGMLAAMTSSWGEEEETAPCAPLSSRPRSRSISGETATSTEEDLAAGGSVAGELILVSARSCAVNVVGEGAGEGALEWERGERSRSAEAEVTNGFAEDVVAKEPEE